eukprot:jgi/Chrzof1/12850/Cz07g09180.t1
MGMRTAKVQEASPATQAGAECYIDLDGYSPIDHPCLQPNAIEDRLYLSSAYTEVAKDVLKKHGITHVLQVGHELTPSHPDDFVYGHVAIVDRYDTDLVYHLPAACTFIQQGQKQGKVLVHCVHGQSRSAAVVIGYLMWRDGVSYHEAYHKVKLQRPRIQPNDGFELQLQLFACQGFDIGNWQGWDDKAFLAAKELRTQQQQQQLKRSKHRCQPSCCIM